MLPDLECVLVLPSIGILDAVPSGLVTKAQTVLIEGTVQDASPVVLRMGGTLIGLSGGAFSVEAQLPGDGERSFVLEAEDAAHNFSQTSVPVLVDRTAPQLQIASPGEGVILGGLPIVVQGTVQDATRATVTVNGVPAVQNGEAWQATFEGLVEGSHSFQAVTVDAAGNEARATRNVRLDLLAPMVSIATCRPRAR